jgi:hypothetical protein
MARVPSTGVRQAKLTIRDSAGRRRQLLCHDLSIPVATAPEMVKVKPEGVLVAVIAADDVESTLSFSVDVSAFLDATQPTVEEIVAGTGLGAAWQPINDAISAVQVDASFRCFYFDFEIDNRAQGGLQTWRTVQAHVKPEGTFARATPNVIKFAGEVFGTIVDSATAP